MHQRLIATTYNKVGPALRPCICVGKPARFHRWCEMSEIIEPSIAVGGHKGGELRYVVGIVEFEDGTVTQALPQQIRFTDGGAKISAEEARS